MSSTAKSAGLAVVAVLAASLTGACEQPTVADTSPITIFPTPTPEPTPTPSAVPTTPVAKPPEPVWIDPSLGVLTSKLYTAGKVPAVRCVLPRPDLTSKAGMLRYARVLVTCMDKAWAPVVERSDAYFVAPEVFAYSLRNLSATPECADPPKEAIAFYHQSGKTGKICFEWEPYLDPDNPVRGLIDFQLTLSHEYGHHVQQSVGILTWYYRSQTTTGLLEDERRMELQASCLGAAFLGANNRTFQLTGRRLAIWQDIVRHDGDDYNQTTFRDHGSGANHAYWTNRAFASIDPASCNTFAAPAKRVS